MGEIGKEGMREAIRDTYGAIARGEKTGCGSGGGCCEPGAERTAAIAQGLGYSERELAAGQPEAFLGLGCGNPHAMAALGAGETVLDLGSGSGFDSFVAARQVGPEGRVIGVDMTAEMVSRARQHAAAGAFGNVEFRLGEIEHLPVADRSVDVILSNCVINLSPDKPAVFREAFRVLRPGGRLAVADMVATRPLPREVREDARSVASCVGGAVTAEELEAMMRQAGFEQIRIVPNRLGETAEDANSSLVRSMRIEAVRPAAD